MTDEPGPIERLWHRLLPPPRAEDGDAARLERLLHAMLLVAIGVVLVFLPLHASLLERPRVPTVLTTVLLVGLGALLVSSRVGALTPPRTSVALVGLLWLFVTASLWLFGGPRRTPVLSGFFAVAVAAALLLGTRGVIVSAAGIFTSTIGLLVADDLGLLPPAGSPSAAVAASVFVASILVVAGAARFATAELRRANERLHAEIAERRLAEERLRESETRFRSVIESSPMGVHLYRLDADNRLVLTGANRAADAILGIPHRTLVGLTLEEAFPGIAGTELLERCRRICAEGAPSASDEVTYSDGRIQGTFQVHAFQTSPGCLATMFLDVTARQEAEETRRQLEKQLGHSQKMEAIGRLAGGVAHDFNNLLMVIMGHGELLRRSLQPEDPQVRKLGHIMNAAERASRLVRQLLAFSRKQVLEPKVVDLNQVVAETARMLHPILGEDVEVQTELAADLGRVRVDPAQVDQVIMNLAVNARDAMPAGGRLLLRTSNLDVVGGEAGNPPLGAGRYVVLAVSDTGAGMDERTRAHLFEPFFTTKRDGQGSGLGLAMVYGIVQQSGGVVGVDSAPGQGSTFRIVLPRVDGTERVQAAAGTSEAAPAGGETVLVVEDEVAIRDLAREFLENRGYEVLSAASGEEALAVSARHRGPIHLLLADVVMLGMSGPALAQRLAAARTGVRVIYMSGYAGVELESHGATGAGVPVLLKPFTEEDLAQRVRERLDESA